MFIIIFIFILLIVLLLCICFIGTVRIVPADGIINEAQDQIAVTQTSIVSPLSLNWNAKDIPVPLPPEGTTEMLNLITSLQGDRLNDQRAELRPVNPQGTLPGVQALHTTRARPEDDFIEVLARVQGTRLEDQRTALPAAAPKPEDPDDEDDFINQLMRAQAGRMEDQRASIPLKSQSSNSKN